MDAYMYRAAFYCERDADKIMQEQARLQPDRMSEDDSEYWPQGPYANGGGESDTPQHCDTCGVFLENPLTDDGLRYVLASRDGFAPDNDSIVERWRMFYSEDFARVS